MADSSDRFACYCRFMASQRIMTPGDAPDEQGDSQAQQGQ